MPFRARMKRAFTRSSSSSSDTSGSLSRTETRGIGDPKIYQPGEQMPRPKYRAPVDKKHTAMLEAFSFDKTTSRRKSTSSGGSLYSPMGSRIPSRHNSIHRPAGWRVHSAVRQVVENVNDDADISNVGYTSMRLSKEVSTAVPDSIVQVDSGVQITTAALSENINAPDHTPFTEAEISHALSRNLPHRTMVEGLR